MAPWRTTGSGDPGGTGRVGWRHRRGAQCDAQLAGRISRWSTALTGMARNVSSVSLVSYILRWYYSRRASSVSRLAKNVTKYGCQAGEQRRELTSLVADPT